MINLFSQLMNSREAGSQKQHGPRPAGDLLHEFFENSNEPLARAHRERADAPGKWNRNTDLCVDLKSYLRSDSMMHIGKEYPGVCRRDGYGHYTFTETAHTRATRSNPHVFSSISSSSWWPPMWLHVDWMWTT